MAEVKSVFWDAGHGGSDPGAVKYVKESEVNIKVVNYAAAYMEENYVCEVHKDITADSLNAIISRANKLKVDLFISVHFNAGGGDGFEALVYSAGNKKLGICFAEHVADIGQNLRSSNVAPGVKYRPDLGVLRLTNMPAILNECAFVDNKKDIQDWDENAELKKMGEALAKAAADWLDLPKKTKPKATSTSKTSSTAKKTSTSKTSTAKVDYSKKAASKVVTASIKKKGKDYKVTPHFTLGEFQCKNGADTVKYDLQTLYAVEAARQFFGVPITVTSHYRTVAYNKKIGGAYGSLHTEGKATDHYAKGVNYTLLAKFYEVYGMKGIGCYYDDHFVHVDSRSSKFYWKNQISTAVSTHLVTVKKGNDNQHVEDLQWLLKHKHGFDDLKIDGDFGAKTEKAVREFQKKHGLVVDGIVGKKTWKKLLAA